MGHPWLLWAVCLTTLIVRVSSLFISKLNLSSFSLELLSLILLVPVLPIPLTNVLTSTSPKGYPLVLISIWALGHWLQLCGCRHPVNSSQFLIHKFYSFYSSVSGTLYKPPSSPSIKSISPQFGNKDGLWVCGKGLAEAEVSDISCSSIFHQQSHSTVGDDQISQAFCEAVLALFNLPCHPHALHNFQEDLLNDLIEHRSEGN